MKATSVHMHCISSEAKSLAEGTEKAIRAASAEGLRSRRLTSPFLPVAAFVREIMAAAVDELEPILPNAWPNENLMLHPNLLKSQREMSGIDM
jgi:hypothetical protein